MTPEATADHPSTNFGRSISPGKLTPQTIIWIFFAVACAWLTSSALFVNIELFDGYSTIANSQHFLKGSGDYFWQRGPLMAWFLIPAEYIAEWLQLSELDVRPHHVQMAVLHAGYLFLSWRILQREFGNNFVTVIAYLAAIPTFVFFSYAPFISHDIFPGVLVLLMATRAHQFMRSSSLRAWLELFALGALIILVKQTYALVWPAIIIASLMQWMISAKTSTTPFRRLVLLALAALASGVVSWSIYSVLLSSSFPDGNFFTRPIELARAVSLLYSNEGDTREIFYQWIYFKNLWAYGLTAMALALPGVVMALTRRGSLLQAIAIMWLLLLATLLVIPIKEVRYLAFLAPMTAALLIPALTQLWELRKSYRYVIGCLLIVDAATALPEALRVRSDFYRNSVGSFFEPLAGIAHRSGDIYFERYLSFVAPDHRAFFGDRYHRITHLDAELISALFEIPRERFHRLDMNNLPQIVRQASATDVFLLATSIAARVRPFRPGNTEAIDPGFIQSISHAQDLDFQLDGDHWVWANMASAAAIVPVAADGRSSMFIIHARDAIAATSPIIRFAEPVESRHARRRGLLAWSLCTLAGCENFARVPAGRPAEHP